MITTVRSELTWNDKTGETLAKTSEKKVKQLLKDLTGAIDVEIISIDFWDEDEDSEDY